MKRLSALGAVLALLAGCTVEDGKVVTIFDLFDVIDCAGPNPPERCERD